MNYYIQGDAANADQIKAAFEKLGYNTRGLNFSDGFFYTVERDVHYCIYDYMVSFIKTHPDYQELELPIEPKFKVGDWIIDKHLSSQVFYVSKVLDHTYEIIDQDGDDYHVLHYKVEEDFRLWTIADAKDGDAICTPNNNLFIYKCKGSGVQIYDYCGLYHGKFEPDSSSPNGAYNSCDGYVPATKEQRDMFFAKMKEAGYEWDEKKKELCKIIVSKFKVGDDIKTGNTIETIAEVDYATRSYCCESGRTIWFENQDLWHLAPKPHYDISNFKPFDHCRFKPTETHDWIYADFWYVQAHYKVEHLSAIEKWES